MLTVSAWLFCTNEQKIKYNMYACFYTYKNKIRSNTLKYVIQRTKYVKICVFFLEDKIRFVSFRTTMTFSGNRVVK